MIKKLFIIFIFTLFINHAYSMENIMILKLKDGDVMIELFNDIAPNHVERFKILANLESYDLKRAGTGGSNYPDLKAEFSELPHERGTLSMARSADPNSANSQFFICFKASAHLDRQYSVVGKVIKGMEFVDLIKRGDSPNGEVSKPDKILSLSAK